MNFQEEIWVEIGWPTGIDIVNVGVQEQELIFIPKICAFNSSDSETHCSDAYGSVLEIATRHELYYSCNLDK